MDGLCCLLDLFDVTSTLSQLRPTDSVLADQPRDRGMRILGGCRHGVHVGDMAQQVLVAVLAQTASHALCFFRKPVTETFESTHELLPAA